MFFLIENSIYKLEILWFLVEIFLLVYRILKVYFKGYLIMFEYFEKISCKI